MRECRASPEFVQATGRRSPQETAVSTNSQPTALTSDKFDRVVQAYLDDRATTDEVEELRSNESALIDSLFRLLDQAEDKFDRAKREFSGAQRSVVLQDLDSECFRIDDAITALIGSPKSTPPKSKPEVETGVVQLQLSWTEGRLVAWAAGLNAEPESYEQVLERLGDHGGGSIGWEPRDDIKIPGGRMAPTLSAPVASTLGWVVGLGSHRSDQSFSVSTIWMGLATAAAVELWPRVVSSHNSLSSAVLAVTPTAFRLTRSAGTQR